MNRKIMKRTENVGLCVYVCGVGCAYVYVFVCNVCECGMFAFVHGDSKPKMPLPTVLVC